MRISNIAHYLGGADDVVAEEILETNQFKKTIASGDNTDFTTTTFTINAELFTGTVSYKRSVAVIENLSKQSNSNVTTYTDTQVIRDKAVGGFSFLIPSTLLSDFNNGVHVFTSSPDSTTPYIVAVKVQWQNGEEIKSIRFLFIIRYQPNL